MLILIVVAYLLPMVGNWCFMVVDKLFISEMYEVRLTNSEYAYLAVMSLVPVINWIVFYVNAHANVPSIWGLVKEGFET